MKLYSNTAIEKLQSRYIEKGGEVVLLKEGSLVDGLVVCRGEGLKSCVLKEVYINSWSSGYSKRFYNKLPKKYQSLVDNN